MDVLDVVVQDSEVHSLDVDLRQEFPEEGMSCKVLGCGDRHYSSYLHTGNTGGGSMLEKCYYTAVIHVTIGRSKSGTLHIISTENIKEKQRLHRKGPSIIRL